ncbi:MAG TPA: hypothetical protein PLD89_11360 [Promineifilum sp.]|nr:hypothetical protein [Promineifilum sp.]
MKQWLLIAVVLSVFGTSIALGYFFYDKTLKQTQQAPGDASERTAYADVGNTAVPNSVEARVKPANQLEATLEYGMEIVLGQAFTEGVFEDMTVKQVEASGNRGTLTLEKNGVIVELPVVGVLGVRKTVGGISETVPVRELSAWLAPGDTLQVRVGFVGSNMTMTQEEITNHYAEKLRGYDYYEEMMEANRLWGVKRLTEDGFVAKLANNPVVFEPEELITLSVNAME